MPSPRPVIPSSGRPAPARGRPARRFRLAPWARGACAAALLLPIPGSAQRGAAPAEDPAASAVVDAREAARKRDLPRLAAARATLQALNHPLLPWADYWQLTTRIREATVDEVEAFYERHRGSYVEDRLRNDWLLELGRRRDLANLARDYPRFRMNDDREVTCWWLLSEHLAGKDVADAARRTWFGQREADDGCTMLATALYDARRFSADDLWRRARLALEMNRPGAARIAVAILGNDAAKAVNDALDAPAAFLKKSAAPTKLAHELRLLAVMRLATSDLDAAVAQLADNRPGFTRAQLAWGWAWAARQAAFRQQPEAAEHVQRAFQGARGDHPFGLSDETLAWGVRALLKAPPSPARWALMARVIEAMGDGARGDPAWTWWHAQALAGAAPAGEAGDAARAQSRQMLEALADGFHYHASLAQHQLGRVPQLPPQAAPSTPAERDAAARHPGLQRALLLVQIGLRDEARREWNFSLRGMGDRELLAAARLACDASDWQLCINTAERAGEIDLGLRYPTPFAADITRAAQDAGLEPALVFGLIRQETRFMPQLRSSVGATGLMQVMPDTARWVARRTGIELGDGLSRLADPQTNLRLGTSYLKLVLDDLGGSQAMATAAYNAGPGRPRRWREGATIDAAAWTEAIPFQETRDYVKKVLHNAAVYTALLDPRRPPALRPRLGDSIGPRPGDAPPSNTQLP